MSHPLEGHATPEGTARYAREHPAADGYYRRVRDLTVSSLGFGSYLGEVGPDANRAYEDAALAALENGVNVLDTAINYRGQQSERDVGRALARYGKREEVVLVTKGGFLAPDVADPLAAEDPAAYIRREYVDTGLLKREDVAGGAHAMTPAYLEDQLTRSLENLGVATVDVYFVHNAESQLSAGVDRETFDARLRDAFTQLEREVDAGRIRHYGLATWNAFRVVPETGRSEFPLKIPPDVPKHHNLADVLRLAGEAREAVGGSADAHHFTAVELPVNLAMGEAAGTPTQDWKGQRVPFLDAARDAGLMVLASASLVQKRVFGKIPDHVKRTLDAKTDVEAAIAFTQGVPGVTTALVGTGTPAHAEENARMMTARSPRPDAVRSLLADAA